MEEEKPFQAEGRALSMPKVCVWLHLRGDGKEAMLETQTGQSPEALTVQEGSGVQAGSALSGGVQAGRVAGGRKDWQRTTEAGLLGGVGRRDRKQVRTEGHRRGWGHL